MTEQQDDGFAAARAALLQAIDLGFTAEAFIAGPIGTYLVLRSERERMGLLERLATVDPVDPNKIAALQRQIGVLDCWQQWIADAVTEGRQAQQELIDSVG